MAFHQNVFKDVGWPITFGQWEFPDPVGRVLRYFLTRVRVSVRRKSFISPKSGPLLLRPFLGFKHRLHFLDAELAFDQLFALEVLRAQVIHQVV